MPPKKLNKAVKKTDQVKIPRRRPKKEKCLTINETEDSIKIPQQNSTRVLDDDEKKDRVVILTKNDINIMLANEVVGRQFPKKSALLKDPINEVVLNVLKQPKKPVLKRKRPLKNNVVLNGETHSHVEEPVKKNVRRRLQPKKLKKTPITIQKCVLPDDTNESIPEVCKNETKKVRRNKTVPKQDLVENVTQESLETPKPKTPRRKLSLNRKPATAGPRTRKKTIEMPKHTEIESAASEDVTSQKENNVIVDTSNVTKEQDALLRRSSLASLSELSWTKDISSSSTTTCATVSSKDFFRIDNKIPILKLTNIERRLKSEENNNICNVKLRPTQTVTIQFDNSLCEKSAIENSDKTNDKNFKDEVDVPHPQIVPNLSSSSSESCSDIDKTGQSVSTTMNKLNDTLEKLSSKLKSFDLEIINWIGYTNETSNPNVEKIQEKLYRDDFLKEEMNVIIHCKNIKRILSGNSQNTETEEGEKTGDNIQTECENNTPNNANLSQSQTFSDDKHNSSYKEKECREQSNHSEPIKEKNIAINKSINNMSYDDDDEDDALSLYAESITGIESSTKNSKLDWDVEDPSFEEYVPQPLSNKTLQVPETVAYQPTKIIKNTQSENSEADGLGLGLGNVCEKQSADSTSLYKEQDNDNSLEENNIIFEDRLGHVEEISRTQNSVTKLIQKTPLLMASIYKSITGTMSVVFKGLCFFNLTSNCKKNSCKFPHISLEVEDVKQKLKMLDDTTFIQEYMLLRAWPGLRWKYGMCFVEECIQRKLTRIIVEVALDFITKVTNKATIINVVENILLYLNKVDLCVCEDLLKYKIQSKNKLLCDVFITTITESQNFSRFKRVFINLTDFMYRIGRTFSEDVAAHVLERVVILPYDEGLARALIKIIKNTEASIFSNSMIGHLEQQLLSSNIELYEEFCSLKDQVLQSHSILGNCYTNSALSDVDKSSANLSHLDKNKRYSPDTTNLDNLTKTSIEPIFTRTIDLNKLNFLNMNGGINKSSSSESGEDKRFTPKNQFKNWRGRKSYDNTRYMQRNQTMRPPLRPPYKRRSDQTFGGSPSKFQRRNGSNFFKDFS